MSYRMIVSAIVAFLSAPAFAGQVEIVGSLPSGSTHSVPLDSENALKTTPKGAIGRAYGSPGDSTTHACSNPETTVTLTGGAGKTYRIDCQGNAWIRIAATASAAAPSTRVIADSPEYWTLTAPGGSDPAVHCYASTATTCIYTPMTDPL